MNDVSVMHFSEVVVLGVLMLPGKNINSSFADARRKMAEKYWTAAAYDTFLQHQASGNFI